MSELNRKTTTHQVEKEKGTGTFEIKLRHGEKEEDAIERKLPSLRKRMRSEITCTILNCAWVRNKKVLTIGWEVAEIC